MKNIDQVTKLDKANAKYNNAYREWMLARAKYERSLNLLSKHGDEPARQMVSSAADQVTTTYEEVDRALVELNKATEDE